MTDRSSAAGVRPREAGWIDLVTDPDADLSPAVECLRRNGLVAHPTETVYGLGSRVTVRGAAALARVKRRPDSSPFILLVRSPAELEDLSWGPEAEALARRFWPGPLTLVIPDPKRVFPPGVRSPAGGVAARVSPDRAVARLLEQLGEPMTSTSANPGGASPALSARAAKDALRILGAADYVVVDGGAREGAVPSTIISCLGPEPAVLRDGALARSELETALRGARRGPRVASRKFGA